jgi:copper chaperone CopZ
MRKIRQAMTCLAALIVCGSAFPVPLLAAAPRLPDRQVQIVDSGMCCAGCARKVSGQLYAARGVKSVDVDLKSRTLTVTLPEPSPAMLGQLWGAVEKGAGKPTKLVTTEATYSLVPPEADNRKPHAPAGSLMVVIENLHCQGCAKKIAAQLYALKGVTKVSVDLAKETLTIETNGKAPVSAWVVLDAVAKAKERPLAVIGSHGELAIEWAQKAAPKNHQQAQQPHTGGMQR